MLTEKQKEIAEKAFRVEWDKPGGTIRNCIRAAVEAVLTAQPAAQPFTVEPDSSCGYCGPICYGGAEHSERVENGDKWKPAQEAPAPSTQNVVLPPLKCRGDYLEARIAQLNEREEQLLSTLKKLAAVRPQIEAERDKAWEKAVVDVTTVRIYEKVRARLTPAQELEERKSVKDLLCARISGQNVCFDADGYDANIIAAYRRGRAEIGEK